MSDDELDPAFAEFDQATAGSLGDSLGFASTSSTVSDLDFDDEADVAHERVYGSFGESLGPGFGSVLEDELRGGYDSGGEDPRSRILDRDTLDGPNERTPHDAEAGFATPRRTQRNGGTVDAHGGGSSPYRSTGGDGTADPRMSLAFELATAASPGNGRGRDLMRELGIEDDESDGGSSGDGGETDMEGRRVDVDEAELAMSGLGRSLHSDEDVARSPRKRGGSPTNGVGFGSVRTAATDSQRNPLRTKPSTASLSSYAISNQTSDIGATGPSFDGEEIDRATKETASRLKESIDETDAFLRRLQGHIVADTDSKTVTADRSGEPLSAPINSSKPTSSPAHAADEAHVPTGDRQNIVERLASSYIKSLYLFSKQREGQTRGATEAERIFARHEQGWRGLLGELEPLPREVFDDDFDSDEDQDPAQEEDHCDRVEDEQASPRRNRPRRPPASSASTSTYLLTDLNDLRQLTASLLSTLSSLTDIVQVQSALLSDSNRKLRALRTQVVGVQEEWTGLERSRDFVEAYERREQGKRRYAEEARGVMRDVEGELDKAERDARAILLEARA
ncbi:hypothetical protein JCM10212_002677 [Sporobolomyces blumeae]